MEVRVGGPRILDQNRARILELLLMRGRHATHMRCIDACSFWEHAKRALLIVVFKKARLHATSVGITTLADLESRNRRLAAEAPVKGHSI
jgi:L-fucose mutarotase/ribose pyranase (RbsD/FucU family)